MEQGGVFEFTDDLTTAALVAFINDLFQSYKREQNNKHYYRGQAANNIFTRAHTHAKGGRHPNGCSGGDARNMIVVTENSPGTKKSYTGYDIGRDAIRIT